MVDPSVRTFLEKVFGRGSCSTALLLLLTFLATAVGQVPPRKPLTHQILWQMKRVGAPVPSPDGKWVVVPVSEPAYDDKELRSDLWILPVDQSTPPRKLTYTKNPESDAIWSPDGQKLAFVTKREDDESNQIYVLDLQKGGEALRVTSVSTGATSPRWRPDATALLFTSLVYPDAPDDETNRRIAGERNARKYSARVYEGFPIRYWDRWLDDRQVHLLVQDLVSGSKPRDLLAGTRMVHEPGYSGRFTDEGQVLDGIWALDGQSIIFGATTQRNRAAYSQISTELYQVEVKGGEPRRLTFEEGTYFRPEFSSDGKTLFSLFTPNNQKVYNLTRMVRLTWPVSGKPAVLTSSFDRSIEDFAIAPDGKSLFLLAEDSGQRRLFEFTLGEGHLGLAIDQESGSYKNVRIPENAPKTTLIATWESAVSPPEVFYLDPRQNQHRRLTTFNTDTASQVDWNPLESFWFDSREGRRIHSFVAFPGVLDRNKKYPLLVLIHGGPHNMWQDQFILRWNPHLLAQPGYVILIPNYTGSTGFGEKFAQEIQLDPFGRCSREIDEAVDEAIRRYPFIDGTRLAAAGASYGGHLVNWLQATSTRYRCLISHAGLVNLESQWGTSDSIYHRELNSGGPVWEQGKVWREQNPIRFAAHFRTPILLTAGENDFRVPLNQTLENWGVLQRLRIPSKLIVFPDENHWIQKGENSRFFYQELHAWLKKWLAE